MATCKCKKCGQVWKSVVKNPKACPACKSYKWREERKRKTTSISK